MAEGGDKDDGDSTQAGGMRPPVARPSAPAPADEPGDRTGVGTPPPPTAPPAPATPPPAPPVREDDTGRGEPLRPPVTPAPPAPEEEKTRIQTRAPVRLTHVKPPEHYAEHGLQAERGYRIGRSSSCDIRLYSDGASREHAQLHKDERGWVLTPEAGKAVVVDGTRVTAETRLVGRARLRFGDDELLFADDTPPATATTSSAPAAPAERAVAAAGAGRSMGTIAKIAVALIVAAALLILLSRWAWAEESVAPTAPSTPTAPGAAAAQAQDKVETPPAFEAMPDRWRIEPPPYELNVEGHWWDPYNQNLLKGDYPIYGQDVFLRLTGISKTSVEGRTAPTGSGVSAVDPGEIAFFGTPDAVIVDQKWGAKLELQKGSTSFRPFDWQLVLLGVVDLNYLGVYENAVVNPDVRDGTTRLTEDAALQEAAVEVHLADVSANYDFISTKIGRQPFNSDFRRLVFADVNQGARLFGSADSNRYQFNLIYFYQAEKDTNSDLNTFALRDQQVAVANLYIQDLLFLGWQNQFNLTWDFDDGKEAGLVFDRQGFLVRPDPVGAATPHNVNAFFLGWTSEGHIGFVNVSHAFYQALGNDTLNPIAGRAVDINAQMAFLELSVDDDWMRYTASAFYSSGDDDPRDREATGFDTILDDPQIMGGDFGYWNRQSIRIADRGGVALTQRKSVVPDLRSSKTQGQANFVNPGILMLNLGATAELTPTLRLVGNAIYLRFAETESLELLLKQPNVREDIGFDLSLGLEYRPFLNNNVAIKGFGAILQPLGGFRDIYQSETLFQVGTEILLVF